MATVTYIKETRQHPSAMVSVMRYCLQESKTVDQLTGQRYVSGIGCDGLNSITEFLATKYAYGKLDGINFYQYVQSFSPRENITYEQAHDIAREFAMKAWPGHEVQVTTHCDAKHIHSHFVINSVSFVDGRKLRQDPNTLKQLRAISDELCREHGMSVLPPYEKGGKRMGSREYRIAAKGKSWKFRLMYNDEYIFIRHLEPFWLHAEALFYSAVTSGMMSEYESLFKEDAIIARCPFRSAYDIANNKYEETETIVSGVSNIKDYFDDRQLPYMAYIKGSKSSYYDIRLVSEDKNYVLFVDYSNQISQIVEETIKDTDKVLPIPSEQIPSALLMPTVAGVRSLDIEAMHAYASLGISGAAPINDCNFAHVVFQPFKK